MDDDELFFNVKAASKSAYIMDKKLLFVPANGDKKLLFVPVIELYVPDIRDKK